MGMKILVIGESGTGKSTSIRNLNPDSTFILNVINKTLPFKGALKKFYPSTKEKKGNMYATHDPEKILELIERIDKNAPNIKTLIIDDFQYVMSYDYLKCEDKGFTKFDTIAKNMWKIIREIESTREDLTTIFLSHSELDSNGQTKFKTIGKMLDDKIIIEGLFSFVFNSIYHEDNYWFVTNNEGVYKSKTPMGMFEKKFIPNDLQYVIEKIDQYYHDDELDSNINQKELDIKEKTKQEKK